MDDQPRQRNRRSQRSLGHIKPPSRGRRRRKSRLAPLLALLGAGLAITALIMLINYQRQANDLRKEQEALRQAYLSASQEEQQNKDAQGPSGTTEVPQTAAPLLNTSSGEVGYDELPQDDEDDDPFDPSLPKVIKAGMEGQETSVSSQTLAPEQSPTPTAPPQRPAMAERFLPLMRRNNDVVGWLKYEGIEEIDFAVVQRDNEFYLDRDFNRAKNVAGTVFLDASNEIWPQDPNLVLHGHNMQNGSMFGKLKRLMEPAFFQANPLVRFDTLYGDTQYVPFAVTLFSANPDNSRYFNIIQSEFPDTEAMGSYVNWLRSRSSVSFPTEVSETDKLLTLVTCHGLDPDERLVVALRALRPGEDAEQIKQAFASQLTKSP